ncbi:MAG: 4Fe-4S dicluster domain-containing protein [Nitrospirae bacterium]|nr:4Fe-4S dicluster domain-containing protein [Nitrospirota bacterium]
MCLPMSCMHCGKPPCLDVCPTGATYRRSDGIVDIKYEICVGCGYCILACPYLARTIVFHNGDDFETDVTYRESGKPSPSISFTGVCSKCDFCLPRVDAGLAKGLEPGLDLEASPMCVVSCTAGALHFGDLDDPDSMVSQMLRENKTACLQEDLGTYPSVYYILD